MAEELALEERRGEGRAVDRDERAVRARGKVVDGLRDELLARAAGALDQDRGLRRGGLADHVEEPLHRGGAADDVLQAVARVEPLVQLAVLALQIPGAQGAGEHEVELVEVHGLREEVLRAELHRLHRRLHRPVGGEQDADRGGVAGARLAQEREAVAAGHADVGEHHVDRLALERLERGGGRFGQDDLVVAAQRSAEALAGVALVVHDEHDGLGGRGIGHWNLLVSPILRQTDPKRKRKRDETAHSIAGPSPLFGAATSREPATRFFAPLRK